MIRFRIADKIEAVHKVIVVRGRIVLGFEVVLHRSPWMATR